MKAQVMIRAWEIAKEAVKNFGGKVKEYFGQALRMAWAEIKKGAEIMAKGSSKGKHGGRGNEIPKIDLEIELKGSEKQVQYAKDLMSKVNGYLESIYRAEHRFLPEDYAREHGYDMKEYKRNKDNYREIVREMVNELNKNIKAKNDAGLVIESFKGNNVYGWLDEAAMRRYEKRYGNV